MIATMAMAVATAQLHSSPAWAQGDTPAPSKVDRAADLFKKAKGLHTAGKLADALPLYLEAWSLHRSPDIAANLAACEIAIGNHRDAAEHFEFALRNLLAGTTADQKTRLTQGLEKAKREVATLRLQIAPEGAEVSVDGRVVGKAPIEADVFVESGPRELRVALAGHETHTQRVTTTRGGTHALAVTLEATATAVTPPAAGAGVGAAAGGPVVPPVGDGGKDEKRASPIPAYVAIGVGVAGLGAGIGLLVMASGKESDKDDRLAAIPGKNKCGPGTTAPDACAEVTSLADDAKQLRTFGYVGFGVAAAGGVLAYLLWPRSSSASSGAVVVPSVGRSGASLNLHGHF